MERIKLQSSDGEIFETDVQAAKCSITIKTMLEDCGLDEDDNAVVPLSNVSSNTLRNVIHWAEHHMDDEPSLDDDEEESLSNGMISSWDKEFIGKVDQAMLFQLMLAANYLDIKGLLELTCRTVAKMIKGKTSAEIRQVFNIRHHPFDNGQ
ncbi:S-phase kinase-associated protein 1-like [Drosophila montana]|uniref:S-phase kinase-associated protein 1-like n=1 Tax=Drosophila montana TaxID=40370 RepID=UPI00313B6361